MTRAHVEVGKNTKSAMGQSLEWKLTTTPRAWHRELTQIGVCSSKRAHPKCFACYRQTKPFAAKWFCCAGGGRFVYWPTLSGRWARREIVGRGECGACDAGRLEA